MSKYWSGLTIDVPEANVFAAGGNTSDDDLVDWIIMEEGFNKKPENIGDGKMTLGSGLTDPKWHELYRKRGNKWTEADNRRAVAEEVAKRRKWAEKTVPNWDTLPNSAQKALLSYKYNYDFNASNSPKLFKALSEGNYREAARQIDATSKNPKFKKGLSKRRGRERSWFLSEFDVPSLLEGEGPYGIPSEVPVSTALGNPYILPEPQPLMIPRENEYVAVDYDAEQRVRDNAMRVLENQRIWNALQMIGDWSQKPAPQVEPFQPSGRYNFVVNSNADGGELNQPKLWNKLSIAEKAEMMKVAIKNGVTDLPTIRQKYNEFAKGGNLYDGESEPTQQMTKFNTTGGAGYIPFLDVNPIVERVSNLWNYGKSYLKHKLKEDGDGEVIDLSKKKVARIKSGTNNITSILTNDFVEHNNNMVRKKKDFVNTTDTLLGDRKIPLSKISTFYGVENGKLKAGPLEVFDDETVIVPNRAKYIGKIKEYHPGRPASKEYKDAVEQGIVEYNNSKGYEPDWLAKLLPFTAGSTPRAILYHNLIKEEGNNREGRRRAQKRRTDIINSIQDKYFYLDDGALPFVVTENNDTIKGYKLNASPKTLFADESGNAIFVAHPRQHIKELNSYLQTHSMYPIMVDNGRYAAYQTHLPNAEVYGGLNRPDDMFIIGTTKAFGGPIHIKKENRGKFTRLKERTGHSATWFKEHGTPAQKKMAIFDLNSRKWKHGLGGPLVERAMDALTSRRTSVVTLNNKSK